MDKSQPCKNVEEADRALKIESRSGRSQRSTRSSASATATTARAKAAACKVKASYAEKEAIMMREQAELEEHQQKTLAETARRKAEVEAELYVLKLQKEAVAASKEADVYDAAALREEELGEDLEKLSWMSNRAERTREYVQTHSQPPNAPNLTSNSQLELENSQYVTQSYVEGSLSSQASTKKKESKTEIVPMKQEHTVQHSFQCSPSKVKINPFDGDDEVRHQSYPVRIQCKSDPLSQEPAGCSTTTPHVNDFTTYLLRKEMVNSGLFRFDDCPENYWAWKTSFYAVTSELNLTSREEINLPIRWLGPDSSNHAKRIKSVCQ